MEAAARPHAPPGGHVSPSASCPPAPVDVKGRLSADKRFTSGASGTPPLLALAPVPGHDASAPVCVCAKCTAAMAASDCELVRSVSSIGYSTPGLRETELAFSPDEAYRTLSHAPVCPSELWQGSGSVVCGCVLRFSGGALGRQGAAAALLSSEQC